MNKQKTEDTKQGLFVHVGGNGAMDMRMARLNAAAPKLLASLKEMLNLPGGQYDPGYDDACARAEAAIAEAEGARDADELWTQGNDLPYVGNPLFEVMLDGGFKRVVQRDHWQATGTLFFKDCAHPLQNAFCDASQIRQWRIKKGVI